MESGRDGLLRYFLGGIRNRVLIPPEYGFIFSCFVFFFSLVFKLRLCYPLDDTPCYSHATRSTAIDTLSSESAMHDTGRLHTNELAEGRDQWGINATTKEVMKGLRAPTPLIYFVIGEI